MSTRTYKNESEGHSASTGLETNHIPTDLEIPNCTIEDVDRALFTLFNSEMPFTYQHKTGLRRSPVIFASGERFAVLRRKEPLRDRAGALILPLVSIMRSGVTQSSTMGAATNQGAVMTVKKKLSERDPMYQQLVNKMNIQNSDDLASDLALENNDPARTARAVVTGSAPGRVATRRDAFNMSLKVSAGKILDPNLGNNIFEIITMPPPKYYTAEYEITFWTQYTQQMNDMLMCLMSLYQNYSQRTFKLETPKGYWFVGYVGDELSPGNNFDDYTDSERIVRYTFKVTVPAYIVGSPYKGAQSTLRKFYSAPQISFDAEIINDNLVNPPPAGIASGDPTDYILEDERTAYNPLPGQAVAGVSAQAAADSRRVSQDKEGPKIPRESVANVGGTYSDDNTTKMYEITKDPFTGKDVKKIVVVKTRITRKGETVFRETL